MSEASISMARMWPCRRAKKVSLTSNSFMSSTVQRRARVPLCPEADVVDSMLDDQPFVSWQVVRSDLFPAEGRQQRPQLHRSPAGLPDFDHGWRCAKVLTNPGPRRSPSEMPRGARLRLETSFIATRSSAKGLF